MADSHANGAYSTVATAPSTPTAGTSLTLATGDGDRFPSVGGFPVTVWATGAQPIFVAGSGSANAEIVRATRSGDVLTITRAQEGTTARTIVVGDQVAATITAKTLTDVEGRLVYQGAFDPGTAYAVGDVVKYLNVLYVCKTAFAPTASSFVASNVTGGSPSTVTLPTGSAAADLVLIGLHEYTGASAVKPSYATLVLSSGGTGKVLICSYVLQAADITAGTLAIPAQGWADGVVTLFTFRDVPLGVDTANATATATLSTAVVTAAGPCFLMEYATAVNSAGTGLFSAAWSPSGFVTASAGGLNKADGGGGYETIASGPSTSRTFTVNTSASQLSTVVAPVLTGVAFDSSKWTEIGSDLVAMLTAKGDQLGVTASGVLARHAVGANGTVKTADSAQADGWLWTPPSLAPNFLLMGA